MKWYLAIFFIGIHASVQTADISCNERMRQGRVGFGKMLLAAVGTLGMYHMAQEVWESGKAHSNGKPYIAIVYPRDTWKQVGKSAITLAAVSYLTYKLAKEGVSSLGVFFTDDEEAQLSQEGDATSET